MNKFIKAILAITALAVIFNSCRKDFNDDDSIPSSGSSSQVNATITGSVIDESNQPVSGVQVNAYGNIVSTDADGIFVLKGDVDKKRCVLEFSKQGYMKRFHAIIPSSTVNYVRIMMQAEPMAQSIMSGSGGTINLGNAGSVALPANAIVVKGTTTFYSGEVRVYASHLLPDDPNFSMLIPGGDLLAVDVNGGDVSLYSYGMAAVTLKGTSGEDLQLAAGSNATITLPISATQTGTAPQSIPLWYFDETTSLWKEEGQATKVGNNYVGNVSHFSWWNCDHPTTRATINGRVVDCEGIPMANVTVTVNGQMTVVTDQNGNYTNSVPESMALTFQVLPQGIILTASNIENVSPLTAGQTFTVPDLVVACAATITGQITGCNGDPVSATISITSNNILVNYCFSSEGSFSITGLPNTSYILTIVASSGIISQQVTFPAVSNTIDLGTQQACNTAGESNSFKIDGVNYSISENLLISEGSYSAAQDVTSCSQSGGMTFVGSTNFILTFSGNQPVSVDLATTITNYNFEIVAASSVGYYVPSQGGSNHFILTVSEYGNVGDSIKGTFHGNMVNPPYQDSVYVTDGKFAFLRKPDQ